MSEQPRKQPIWAWIVIGLSALSLLPMGPGAIMLPVLPLLLAGFSTDAPGTPEYVPILILVVGYGLLVGWVTLIVFAIRAAIKANQKQQPPQS